MTIAILFFGTGCKNSELATQVKEKCADSSIKKRDDGKFDISLHCVDLYKTDKIKKLIEEGKIIYDVANAELSIKAVSADSIPSYYQILKEIAKGLKK